MLIQQHTYAYLCVCLLSIATQKKKPCAYVWDQHEETTA